MQLAGYGLPRILLLGSRVNKGIKRKGNNTPWDSTLPHARFSAPLPVES
jgi:hypothetical protein